MTQTDQPAPATGTATPPPAPRDGLRQQLRPVLFSVPLLTMLTGVLFPLALAALACPVLPYQAGGSLVFREGVLVGSELIGQDFSGPRSFHPRPSAAGHGYEATASGGSNLGPAHPKLRARVRALADVYRRRNGLATDTAVPIDAVTCSGSGLDPHISQANATLQIARVARARNLSEDVVRRLVDEHTHGRQLGFLGQPRVNVLMLNLALDRAAPPTPVR